MSDTQWISQADAARALGVSERTIDTWVAERRLGTRQQPMLGRRAATLIDAADVERLNAEKAAANNGAILQPFAASSAVQPAAIPAEAALTALARLAQILPAPAVAPKLFLTLPAAAEYSGLPAGLLRRLIQAGRLPAEPYGRGRFYIRTADLDEVYFNRHSEDRASVAKPLRELRKGA